MKLSNKNVVVINIELLNFWIFNWIQTPTYDASGKYKISIKHKSDIWTQRGLNAKQISYRENKAYNDFWWIDYCISK